MVLTESLPSGYLMDDDAAKLLTNLVAELSESQLVYNTALIFAVTTGGFLLITLLT